MAQSGPTALGASRLPDQAPWASEPRAPWLLSEPSPFATSGGAREDDCSLASFDTRFWADESSSDREPGRTRRSSTLSR